MRVFGIDPGSAKLGFGVVDCEPGRFHLVDHGTLQANRRLPFVQRMVKIHDQLAETLARHAPEVVAIEGVFHGRNPRTAIKIGVALLILAILDYAFQRWKHERDIRMTPQEVREEMKNLEGNPEVFARRRQVQRQLAMTRLSEAVPKADVVITNPTELAVAIQYEPETMAAPTVAAKGAGVIAGRIRRLALERVGGDDG